jgi:3',5'-cyclic AMP phosphodiesterase CpdA
MKTHAIESTALLALLAMTAPACGDDGKGAADAGPDGGPDAGVPLQLPVELAVISDTHLYASSLGMSEAAEEALQSEPGLFKASEAIVESTLLELAGVGVELLLISGDLTSNGAAESHQRMAELLAEARAAGIQPLVVPGNHDIANQHAVSYETWSTPVDSVSEEEFRALYAECGYDQAIHQDPESLSYVAAPIDGVWFLMLDSRANHNGYSLYGAFTPSTLDWAVEMAAAALEQGSTPIAVMHHGLLEHIEEQDTLFAGFLISDAAATEVALTEAGIPLVFTGHYHTQDISYGETGDDFVYDVETASLITYPIPYRRVLLTEGGAAEITTHYTGVVDYDPGDGSTFDEYAYAMVQLAFEAYITDIGEQYGLTQEQIDAALPLMKEAWLAHLLGDEEMTEEQQQAADELASEGFIMLLVLDVIEKLLTDIPPADNELTIDLVSGEHTP